jgi:hypothetical protein
MLAQLALDVVELVERYWRGHSPQAVHRRWLTTVRPITLASRSCSKITLMTSLMRNNGVALLMAQITEI